MSNDEKERDDKITALLAPDKWAGRDLPKIDAALVSLNIPVEERRLIVMRLAALPLSEDELLAYLNDQGAGDTQLTKPAYGPIRKQWNIWRHEITRWWNHRNPLTRVVYGTSWLALLVGAAIQAGKGALGWPSAVLACVLVFIKLKSRLTELDPDHMKDLKRTHAERQLLLGKLIHTAQRWSIDPPSKAERREYQQDALRLITSYMRDHSSDLKGKLVFVNLLQQTGPGTVMVIGRSDANRPFPKLYRAEQCSLVWEALQTGVPQVTGDVYVDAPATPPGKRYHSIMVLPVKLRDRVLAAVSIDSEARHHFDRYFDRLKEELSPYVQLIAISLSWDHDTSTSKALPSGENDDDSSNHQ